MPSTVVVRSASGVLFEMDVPAAGHALELWNEKLAKGDLAIVDQPVEWFESADGTRNLRLATVQSDTPEAPRRGRPPKVQAPTPLAVEATPDDAEE